MNLFGETNTVILFWTKIILNSIGRSRRRIITIFNNFSDECSFSHYPFTKNKSTSSIVLCVTSTTMSFCLLDDSLVTVKKWHLPPIWVPLMQHELSSPLLVQGHRFFSDITRCDVKLTHLKLINKEIRCKLFVISFPILGISAWEIYLMTKLINLGDNYIPQWIFYLKLEHKIIWDDESRTS